MHARVRRLTLINSIIGICVAGISTRVFMISVPTLANALGTDMLGISWALVVYQVAAIGLGVICGRLGDMYGHHRLYSFGMAIMAIGALLCGLSQNIFQLILFRFLQGVGAAMVQSSGRTLGYKAMPEGSEGKAQGLMTMSHQIGFFIGPPIGGFIIDWVHWRGIFFFMLVPSLVGVALCNLTPRAVVAPDGRNQAIDYPGALLFLGLTILITMLLDQKVSTAMGAWSQAFLAAAIAGTLWAFVSQEKTVKSPMIDLSLFSSPAFRYGSLGLMICCITQGLSAFITPFYLQDVLKLSPSFIGMIFLVPSIVTMVFSPLSGAMTDRIGARFLLLTGIFFMMAAFFIGANLHANSHWILPTLLLAFLGMGSAFFNTPSQAVMVSSVPKQHWGIAIGVINGIFGLGQMLGISLTGIFLTLAFRFYSGDPATTPDPRDTKLFAASMNVTYAFALAMLLVPLVTSLKSRKFLEALPK
jgi:MFS family permease